MNRSVEFSSNEVFLYFYLLNECNIRGWQNPFEHPNKTIVLATGISEKTVIEVRNRLQQKGLITFESGKKNAKSPVYYLLDVSKTVSKKVSKEVSKRGSKYTAVSTPGDILFHIRARQMGLCYEFASIIDEKLKGAVEAIDETHGFRYMDGKAIIGFVDGTESPAVDENPYHFAVVGEEDPDFAGGSYVFVQKYIHDMNAWNALPVEEQEKVIGRRKFNDVELSDEEKPANAHNAVRYLRLIYGKL